MKNNLLSLLLKNTDFIRGKCYACGNDFIFTEGAQIIMVDLSWSSKKPQILDILCPICKTALKKKKIKKKRK